MVDQMMTPNLDTKEPPKRDASGPHGVGWRDGIWFDRGVGEEWMVFSPCAGLLMYDESLKIHFRLQ